MPIVTFGQLICYLYIDPSAWDFEDLRSEVMWHFEDSIEAAYYSMFDRLARLAPSDVFPERGDTVQDFVRARVLAAVEYIQALSIQEYWAFQFELVPDENFTASLLNLPQPPIPANWLQPPGPTCSMCGSRDAGQHHTGELLCQNCVDNHFYGCW